MNPLARPPLHPFSGIDVEDRPVPPRPSALSRLRTEVEESLANMDPLRMVWDTGRFFPDFTFARARARFLAILGCDISPGTAVLGHITLVGPPRSAQNLRIGPGCLIAPGVTLCLDASITLGRNVSLGPRATLYTATHALGGQSRRMHLHTAARPIVVDDGAWIGLGALILGGVHVGRGAVVAAGAVVGSDVPDNALVSGNPATIVEQLPSG